MFQTLYRKISPACKTSKFIIEVFFPRKRRWLKRLWKVRKAWTNERKNEKVVEGFTHIDIFWNLFCLKSKKWSKKFRERKLALSFIIKIRSENYLNLKIILAAIHRQVALLIKLLLFITGKLKKIDQYRPFFVYFGSFPTTIPILQIEKLLWSRTRVRRIVGADETTEIRRAPIHQRKVFLTYNPWYLQ